MGLFQRDSKNSTKNKNEFIQKLKSYIDDESRRVLHEDFFEWKVKNWNSLSDNNFSPKFSIGKNKWFLNIHRPSEYISVDLKNISVENNNFAHITTKIVMYIRNPYDYKCFHHQVSSFENYSKHHNSVNFNLIKRSDLFSVIDNNSLLDHNKGIIGVYIRIYRYDKENLLNEIKWKEEPKENQIIKEYFYEWKTNQTWVLMDGIAIYSSKFFADNKEWILKLNSNYMHSESTFFLKVNAINVDRGERENNLYHTKYTKSKMIVYIRNSLDYSCYCYGICHPRSGVTFIFPKKSPGYLGASIKTPIENNNCTIGIYLRTSFNVKDMFMDKVKRIVDDEHRIVKGEGHYEWSINHWNQLSEKEISPEFIVGDHKWILELYPSGLGTSSHHRNFVIIHLKNTDSDLDDFTHICVKKVFYIRNSNDYFCNQIRDDESLTYYSKNFNIKGCHLIEHPDLYIERGDTHHQIIENNRCVVGVYFRIYKYEQEYYKNEMKCSISNENREVRGNGFLNGKLKIGINFLMKIIVQYLELLIIDGHEDNQDYVTVQLQNMDVINDEFLKICTKAVFFIRNFDNTCFTYKGLPTFTNYSKRNNCRGVCLIRKSELYARKGNNDQSLLESNQCIVGVYIRIYKNENVLDLNSKINVNRRLSSANRSDRTSSIEGESSETIPFGESIRDNRVLINEPEDNERSLVRENERSDTTLVDENNERSNGTDLNQIKSTLNNLIEKKKYEKRIKEMDQFLKKFKDRIDNDKEDIDNTVPKEFEKKNKIPTPTLVISKNDFYALEYYQLDIRKDEFLIVTDWDGPEGWVYGHRKGNREEQGFFPKVFVDICNEKDADPLQTYQNQITPEYRIIFENKINRLRSKELMKVSAIENKILINRDSLLSSSFDSIINMSRDNMKKSLRIKYIGEEGVDAGGLLRDFFYQISKEIGNPNYLLLQYSSNNSYEFEINPNSSIGNPLYLKYFKFIGRIMALAILNKQYFPLSFTLPFYKKLLGKKPEFSDLQYVDREIYNSLNWIKDNNGVENLCLTFEIEEKDCFGNRKKIELKPNGSNIDVTDENKKEYIELVVKNKLNNLNDKKQFEALKEGFYEIIPKNINSLLNEFDLKFLITGINVIDVDDWEYNTLYDGYSVDDPTIINFWKVVRELTNDKRIQLLLFATGSSQVPITGFKDLQGNGKVQQFKLKKSGTTNEFPISHTCFNRIDLPPYTSYTQLKQKLLRAITEGIIGFQRD